MRIKRFFLMLPILLGIGAGGAPGAPLERDLGQGLSYVRVHTLPDDLPAAAALRGRSCVLDLRYVQGDPALAATLVQWLKAHASPHTPVLLLANRQTSAELLAPFPSADAIAGLVIIGPAAPGFSPDVALPVTAAEDRRAYDALDRGVTVAALLDDSPNKPRNDEARLERDHQEDSDPAAEPANADPLEAKKGPPPLIDAVLQRAVQLHRSLLALKRL
jgi:hypothetical protein